MFFVMSRAWDKQKILSPHEESNFRPSDSVPRYSPFSHRDLMVGKAHYEVHRILLLVSRLPQRRKPMDPALLLFIVCGLPEQLPLKLLTDTTLHTL